MLLHALDTEDLNARVTEALPGLPLTYPDMDWDWLTLRAKMRDRQNRLGFVGLLARDVAREHKNTLLESTLDKQVAFLERSRLAGEDTLCKSSMTQAERAWLRTHRTDAAVHWNLLSDLTTEQLSHVVT